LLQHLFNLIFDCNISGKSSTLYIFSQSLIVNFLMSITSRD